MVVQENPALTYPKVSIIDGIEVIELTDKVVILYTLDNTNQLSHTFLNLKDLLSFFEIESLANLNTRLFISKVY
jgi:hypothetical protein